MRVVKSILQLRQLIQQAHRRGKRIGFVPTMGALHEGHAALLRQCHKENDIVILSIFVNPKQFGPNEDLKKYPRNFKNDEGLAKKEKTDIIFYPSVKDIYPANYLTSIKVENLGKRLCGATRPTHFEGVTTVVGKLLNIVQPDSMYLGEKDAQQVIILKKMVADLNFPVYIKTHSTVREANGLAMSSRNKYLSVDEKQEAAWLYRSLKEAKNKIQSGEKNAGRIIQGIKKNIHQHTSGKIDYIECVEAETLNPIVKLKGNILIALAVKIGKARLIDNIQLSVL